MAEWVNKERKKARTTFAKRYEMSFMKGGTEIDLGKKDEGTHRHIGSISFPSESAKDAFEKEFNENRMLLDLKLRETRYKVAVWLIGGDIANPKDGYTKKQASEDVVAMQVKVWEKHVRPMVEKQGGTLDID